MDALTIEQVIREVAHIDKISGDDEAAHSERDELWESVLRDIAKGNPIAAALAIEALKTEDIAFARWCA